MFLNRPTFLCPMIKIAQGAEAVLYLDKGQIIKERLSKSYRLPHIDDALRKFRTRREAKILQKLEGLNFPAPHLQDFCDKRMSIAMDFIPGEKLKDLLLKDLLGRHNEYQKMADEIGEKIAKLHLAGIVHGDLTTSNMIKHHESGEIIFIDFGLSFFSDKVEDQAVDLFLLDQALATTHSAFYPGIFEKVVEGYKRINSEAVTVFERLEQVKKRGRNKK